MPWPVRWDIFAPVVSRCLETSAAETN
jgi:hypothetical protein